MGDYWVTIKIRKSTKDKLDTVKQQLRENHSLDKLTISYAYAVDRCINTWLKL